MRGTRGCKVWVAGILIAMVGSLGARAQLVSAPFEALNPFGDYFDVIGFYAQLDGLLGSYHTCRARGYSDSLCTSAFQYCAISAIPIGGIAGTYFSMFQTWEAFKQDCGDGQCFACCLVPASSSGSGGCHTSFPSEDGGPVINCNPTYYGAGTRQVGMALVLNGQPGQACLFTQQVCDHLPLCQTVDTPAQIAAIDADPQNIMKSSSAVINRAQGFAGEVLGDWSDILNGYSTSSAVQSDAIAQQVHSLASLGSFITGRGCAGWRTNLPSSFPNDWSEPQFRINDSSGHYAAGPSQYNGFRQLGLVRFISSVPNLWNRLAYVESVIWTPGAMDTYLAGVDADAVFLRSMSPLALDILKRNKMLQDYRLLAVPVPGETATPGMFNGCLLAAPPALTISYKQRSSFGVDLTVQAADSATTSNLAVSMLVVWGDGSVTPVTVPAGNQPQLVSHDYATGGKYQVFALAENDAGLRTVGALVATTAGSGANPAASPQAVVSEVQLVNLQAEIISLTGGPAYMLFAIDTWPTASQGYSAGISATLSLPLNTPVSFGTVAGWNTLGAPLQAVSIVPSMWGDGPLIGFNSNFFTLDRLRVGVYSTQDRALRYLDIPVTPDIVRLYPQGGTGPVLLTQPTYDSNGRLKIPVQAGGVIYDRVDLVFPPSVLGQAVQGPVINGSWTGVTGTFTENHPIGDHQIPPPATSFYTVTPCRLIDTRGASGPMGAPSLQAGSYRSFASAGTCGIPADAKSVSVNVTVVSGTTPGFLRFFAGTRPVALTSTIDYATGQVRANNALVALSNDGTGTFTVHLDSGGTVELVVDVNGYFK
jgi:hypothetical protein